MALRSDAGPARSPAYASAAALRRDSPLAPICRIVPIPTLAALAQEVFRTRGWRRVRGLSRRADARSLSLLPMRATTTGGWNGSRLRSNCRPRRGARVAPMAESGSAPATASRRIRRSRAELELSHAAADARPTAQSIGELALPRLAAGEGVAAADAAPFYVRHRVALTAAEQAAGARL